MPPAIGGWILDAGVPGLLLAMCAWLAWRNAGLDKEAAAAAELVAAERKARNDEGLAAAGKMYEQQLINQEAKAAIALRDYRIEDLTKDLDRCERALDRCQTGAGGAHGGGP